MMMAGRRGGGGASEADVKSAYRNAAMKFHPDRNAGLGADAERVAAERFRRASEAYDVLSHRGGAPGGSSSSRYASHARKPPSGGGHSDQSSQRKSGYYNGAADPFGFRYKRSDRVGDHMRRIDGNIRALYATLALVGVALYLAPQPSSPAETAHLRYMRSTENLCTPTRESHCDGHSRRTAAR